ncbi:MAG: IS1 family transposase [Crocinitomicaceae bacterium]|nr:IS1 family transposase [Crocinitomicaceae bacterium]
MKLSSYRCRECDNSCHRHGKIKNKQRWKCQSCGLTQFRVYKQCIFTPDRTTIIKRLNRVNRVNIGVRGIARLMGVSPTQIVRCLLQLASLVKRPDYYEYGQEYELDEIWSYAGKKKNECWIVWAINRRTRVVVDFVVGSRTKNTVNKLIEKLKRLHPKQIRTDKWSGYDELFEGIPKADIPHP